MEREGGRGLEGKGEKGIGSAADAGIDACSPNSSSTSKSLNGSLKSTHTCFGEPFSRSGEARRSSLFFVARRRPSVSTLNQKPSAKSAMLFGILFSKFDSQTRLHHVDCSRSLVQKSCSSRNYVLLSDFQNCDAFSHTNPDFSGGAGNVRRHWRQGYPNYCLRLSPTDKADACTGNPLFGIKGCEKIDEALPFLAQFFQLGPLVGSPADFFPGGVSRKSDGVG
ncbi:hypothetical protein RHMOL_Rhmol01G0209900 [Rhododendron molle]|uniref:Uncharacterized protein n=7 Tax=Rhododendron molle TaxID=49168 RepID=A0ACC0NSF5_RHOML|nr:hypothetical protein RHMOL_Rhmol05G0179700 [Rhododendron molle]KAI8555523.1 hypothetical protein RHMOL_Rhmol05G0179700 [Rhododendron molle]KAI8555524.1 hypothetical protein RHMOL_Rhmol05G0179700 [Rhododendron molle]KAI8555525.1 hypothetical protein RHMOL_Rhmol05G0179700 [Rhododendron molle]KAI8572568.1 hypothetical protein RHMOL_Rhmol01G0209900 [Rhododendron molle]